MTSRAGLLLLIALGVSPLSLAQEQPGESAVAEPPPPTAAAEPATPTDSNAAESGDAPEEDPLDYQASEQISEDLSVSFPVDI